MLALLGCCLVSLHFLRGILHTGTVQTCTLPFPATVVNFPDDTTASVSAAAAAFSGDGFASFLDPSDDDASSVSFDFSIGGGKDGGGGGRGRGGILLRKGDFALEMTEDGAALETVLYMEEDSIREAIVFNVQSTIEF